MPSALILGGGLAGMAAAYSLARAGWREITIVERGTITNLARLLGTSFEDRFSVEFDVSYVLALEPETLLEMSAVALDVDFTRGDGSPSVDINVTRVP